LEKCIFSNQIKLLLYTKLDFTFYKFQKVMHKRFFKKNFRLLLNYKHKKLKILFFKNAILGKLKNFLCLAFWNS